MWLSLIGMLSVIALCIFNQIILRSWHDTRALIDHLKRDLKTPEQNDSNTIIQVVGFAKLWFRKQFALIDKELSNMNAGLVRTGLIAIREEYSDAELQQTLCWQRNLDLSKRIQTLNAVQSLNSNWMPIALLVATTTMIVQLWLPQALPTQFGVPALCIMAFALTVKMFSFETLITRLTSNLLLEQRSLELCSEGLLMLNQHKTPAQIRALMEGMTEGLNTMHRMHPSTQSAKPFVSAKSASVLTTKQAS